VNETLDELVRKTREACGFTQSAVAQATRTTVSRISRIERGSELLGFPKSVKLAKCLNLEHKRVVTAMLQSLLERAGLTMKVQLATGVHKRRPRAGEEVARLRYAAGYSVRQLAQLAGMLPSRIAKVENDGDLVLLPATAARFADAMGASRVELVELALQDLLVKHSLGHYRVRVR
jgi:transcriptional regulator with XRE-family HTH domain